ncbi:MAG: translation initiation factor IF-2, partial [Dehalococcoidia bacterium]
MTTPGTRKRPVTLPAVLTVKDLAGILGVSPVDVIKRLMTNGVMAAMNQTIDYEAAALVARECGFSPEAAPEEKPGTVAAGPAVDKDEDDPASLVERAPIVTVLGHVDHGKTSLLDAIRETDVVSGEAGGITQHIGAYQVDVGGKPVTFIDTPGHAAFTAMRARGAQLTDIAVLVIAADDGVMPQTVEAINHAKAAGVPIVVAINKCDVPAANPDRVKQQLTEHELVVEDYGGDVVAVEVSAVKRTGVSDLLEALQLVAELEELKANPNRPATGIVVEAQLETNRGPIATVLVERGTLRRGDSLVVGEIGGKVKAMFDFRGQRIRDAGPSTPAVVMGISSVPEAGERFRVVENDKTARRIVEERQRAREAAEGTAEGRANL